VVPYAQGLAQALHLGLKGAAAGAYARGGAGIGGHILDVGGPILEDVVGIGQETGERWAFHKGELVVPKGAPSTPSSTPSQAAAGQHRATTHIVVNISGYTDASLVAKFEAVIKTAIEQNNGAVLRAAGLAA
jgi:hypothetical protein